ncbi:MAG: hypothetical protein IPK76_21210 [Lewinellaceae bacterium]|nr:hypothetical protein [Lewinellaceae bacterium]
MVKLGFEAWGKNEKRKTDWERLKYVPNFFTSPIQHDGSTKKTKIFVSYAHSDGEDFKDKLGHHLSALRNQDIIADWNDRNIRQANGTRKSHQAMEDADIFSAADYAGFPRFQVHQLQRTDHGLPKIQGRSSQDISRHL